MDLSALVQFVQHQRLVMDYMFISASAVYIYDYFLTLHLEIKLIWRARWSYTTILYFLIRYTALLSIILVLYNQLVPDLSANRCQKTFTVSAYLLVCQISIAEAVLAIRTWAIWNRNKIIGIALAARIPSMLVVELVFVNRFLHSLQHADPPYPGFRGCFNTRAQRSLWQNYTMLTVAEAALLILMIISAFRSYRRGNNNELSYIIHRDGILSYVFLFCITVVNLVITIVLPIDMMILLTPLEDVLYSVLTTRIVLNIRLFGSRGLQPAELHTGFDESPATIALHFMSDEQGQGPRGSHARIRTRTVIDCHDIHEP